VEPNLVATSPIKIAFYVPREEVERTVRALHDVFELSSAEADRGHV
jgi:aspartokinase